jgi:hypothetical protein
VASAEEASLGVAEFWSGNRLIGVTCQEEGELALRLEQGLDDMVIGAHALHQALGEADRLLALY